MTTSIDLSFLSAPVDLTALVVVTSHKSGGLGRILACVLGEISETPLTSKNFKNFSIGAFLKVSLTVSKSGRRINSMETYDIPSTYTRSMAATTFAHAHAVDFVRESMLVNGTRITDPEPITVNTLEPLVVETPKTSVDAPDWFDGFFMPKAELESFEVAYALAETLPSKIMMIGPSGYGKTTLGEAFAIQKGMNFVRFNVALVRDPEEFFGFRTAEGGDVKFQFSEFSKAIMQGNTVVVLDELNRASSEMANALFPILDDAGKTHVFGQEIAVGPRTIIIATVNLGYQFTGTYTLDQALVNRMDITLRVGPLAPATEEKVLMRRTGVSTLEAHKIVEICTVLRELCDNGTILVDASTRTSLKVARIVATGRISVANAFKLVVVNGANIDEQKDIIDAISSRGGVDF